MSLAGRARSLLSRLKRRLFSSPARAAGGCPLSASVNLNDPLISAAPFGCYEVLRGEGGVIYLEKHDAWLVLGDKAAREVLSNWADYSSAPWSFVDPVLLGADPPEHGLVRRIVARRFSGETLRRLEALTREVSAQLIAPQFDAVGGYARPVTREVARELIGFSLSTLETLTEREGAPNEAGSLDRLLGALDTLADQSSAYTQFLAEGAAAVGPDEARSLVRLMWLASTATSERAIARSVLHLAEDQALQARLRAELTLVPRFVDEMIRLFPPEMIVRRVSTRPAALEGVSIPQGAQVFVCLPAANRDPNAHERPAELTWTGDALSLSFGGGPHTCVGGPLGRRMVTASIETLLARSRSFSTSIPVADVPFMHSMTLMSPSAIPLRVEMT